MPNYTSQQPKLGVSFEKRKQTSSPNLRTPHSTEHARRAPLASPWGSVSRDCTAALLSFWSADLACNGITIPCSVLLNTTEGTFVIHPQCTQSTTSSPGVLTAIFFCICDNPCHGGREGADTTCLKTARKRSDTLSRAPLFIRLSLTPV